MKITRCCARIDECQEWANKAEALASYAKMADDDSLRQMATRDLMPIRGSGLP